MKYYNKVAG